jgi:DNA-binding NarL/FixJ family response regulator
MSKAAKEDPQIFTPHERTILNFIAEGYKNQEIANELYMSE